MNVLVVGLPKLAPLLTQLCTTKFTDCNCVPIDSLSELESYLSADTMNYVVIPYHQETNDATLKSTEWINFVLKYNHCSAVVLANRVTPDVRSLFASKSILNYLLNQEDSPDDTAQQLVELIQRHRHNQEVSALVVDDSAAYRAQISYFLRVHGLSVMTAKDGKEALDMISQHPIRLVITDYHMPVMDGLTLTKEIRKTRGKEEISIIAITATDGSNGATEFLKVGANDFLVKPYSREELICRVDQNIDIIMLLDKMRERADRDYLTQLYNRRYFMSVASQRYQTCKADKLPVAVAMLDIDHFKQINDTYGHEAGDEALRQISSILLELTPNDQLVARLGGEEFVIMLTGTRAQNVEQWLEHLRQVVENREISLSGKVDFYQTISVGCIELAGDQLLNTLTQAMRVADKALYQAKHQGRNRVVRAEVHELES